MGVSPSWDTRSGNVQRNYMHGVPDNDVVTHSNHYLVDRSNLKQPPRWSCRYKLFCDVTGASSLRDQVLLRSLPLALRRSIASLDIIHDCTAPKSIVRDRQVVQCMHAHTMDAPQPKVIQQRALAPDMHLELRIRRSIRPVDHRRVTSAKRHSSIATNYT
jgi:hypothetical protein